MTKPTMWLCAQRRLRSASASAQSDQSLRFRMKKGWILSYPLNAQRRLWSDWADAQADLSLRCAHSHFVGFVMRRLNFQSVLFPRNLKQDFKTNFNADRKKKKHGWQTFLHRDSDLNFEWLGCLSMSMHFCEPCLIILLTFHVRYRSLK